MAAPGSLEVYETGLDGAVSNLVWVSSAGGWDEGMFQVTAPTLGTAPQFPDSQGYPGKHSTGSLWRRSQAWLPQDHMQCKTDVLHLPDQTNFKICAGFFKNTQVTNWSCHSECQNMRTSPSQAGLK